MGTLPLLRAAFADFPGTSKGRAWCSEVTGGIRVRQLDSPIPSPVLEVVQSHLPQCLLSYSAKRPLYAISLVLGPT
jgi:hypothetical protein